MAAFHQTVCNNAAVLFTCTGLMVDVQVANNWSSANTGMPTLTYDSNGNVTNTWQFNPGNAGDVVVVRVMYLWPVFFGQIAEYRPTKPMAAGRSWHPPLSRTSRPLPRGINL